MLTPKTKIFLFTLLWPIISSATIDETTFESFLKRYEKVFSPKFKVESLELDPNIGFVQASDVDYVVREGGPSCNTVAEQIQEAKRVFVKMKELLAKLRDLQANRQEGRVNANPEVDSIYEALATLREKMLSLYPDSFDQKDREIHIVWELPERVFVSEIGPLVRWEMISSKFYSWKNSGITKLPEEISVSVEKPRKVKLVHRLTPVQACSGTFTLTAYVGVAAHVMTTHYFHLGASLDL